MSGNDGKGGQNRLSGELTLRRCATNCACTGSKAKEHTSALATTVPPAVQRSEWNEDPGTAQHTHSFIAELEGELA